MMRAVASTDELFTGRSYLRHVQYADERNLAARQSIYAYQHPVIDLCPWALSLADPMVNDTVVDVGCGNGRYLRALRAEGHRGPVVGIDLSPGMLTAARAADPASSMTVGDAAALPLRTDIADCSLAMHRL